MLSMNAITPDVPADLYHASDGLSKSSLAIFDRSPAQYVYSRLDDAERSQTPAMRLGELVHTAVLEPERFSLEFVCSPTGINKRTKQGRIDWHDFVSSNPGKTVVTPDEWAQCLDIRDAVVAHPVAKTYLNLSGIPEASVLWRDSEWQIDCRCRPDWLTDTIVVDLKTAFDASPEGFNRAVANFKYHWQDYYYRRGLHAVTGKPFAFVFVVVETKPPYDVGVYELSETWLTIAESEVNRAVAQFVVCKESEYFPGYSTEVQILEPPAWIVNKQRFNHD